MWRNAYVFFFLTAAANATSVAVIQQQQRNNNLISSHNTNKCFSISLQAAQKVKSNKKATAAKIRAAAATGGDRRDNLSLIIL